MELHQLRYFVQTARLESVSQAAELLHVSQPAVSKAIAHLEDELGVPLFDRMGKKLLLNDKGRAYLKSAQRILRELNEANEAVSELADPTKGSLHLGVFGQQSEAAECVSLFMQSHPNTFLTFDARHQTSTSQLTRNFDMVFYIDGEAFEGIHGVTYAHNRLHMAVPLDHPLAGADRANLTQFKDDHFVFMNTTAGLYERCFRICLDNGFSPKVRAVTSSGMVQTKLIQDGQGVGFMDGARMKQGPNGPAYLELDGIGLDEMQCFACRPPELLTHTARAFLDHTLAFFGVSSAFAMAQFARN